MVWLLIRWIPTRLISNTNFIGDLLKALVGFSLLLALGYILLRWVVIPVVGNLTKNNHRLFESYYLSALKGDSDSFSRDRWTSLILTLPFKYHRVVIELIPGFVFFVAANFLIGFSHHLFQISDPIENYNYMTRGEVTTALLVDNYDEFIETDYGEAGYKEWAIYEFKVNGDKYKCNVAWSVDRRIQVQYLDFNPAVNREYIERSQPMNLLGLIGSTIPTLIILWLGFFEKTFNSFWDWSMNSYIRFG